MGWKKVMKSSMNSIHHVTNAKHIIELKWKGLNGKYFPKPKKIYQNFFCSWQKSHWGILKFTPLSLTHHLYYLSPNSQCFERKDQWVLFNLTGFSLFLLINLLTFFFFLSPGISCFSLKFYPLIDEWIFKKRSLISLILFIKAELSLAES